MTLSFEEQTRAREQALTRQGPGIEGTWQGLLYGLNWTAREVLRISRSEAGDLMAELRAIDYRDEPMSASVVKFDGALLRFANPIRDFTFEGEMSPDFGTISGTLRHEGISLVLALERATPQTQWTIPIPTLAPVVPPMRREAQPGIYQATIRLSNPGLKRSSMTFREREIVILGYTLAGMLKATFDVHDKQIVNLKSWMNYERFDINVLPDEPGAPDGEQFNILMRRLLADRFCLRFHEEEKNTSTYILSVAEGGSKMIKSTNGPIAERGLISVGPLGLIRSTNATMHEFATRMQEMVLDRPVVDRTGLGGKWNFTLRWMPDEFQFGGRFKLLERDTAAEALLPLFSAIQEQLGLRLDVHRTRVKVMVIDHAEHSPQS
jgi:uncharacterized protein (TIGR03435 family)